MMAVAVAKKPLISKHVGAFCLWLLLFGLLYYVFAPTYIRLLLSFSNLGLDIFIHGQASLFYVPDKGLALAHAKLPGPLGFRYDIYSITLNVIFAPALVMTTLTPSKRAWLLVAVALLIMLFLQAYQLITIVLHFLVDNDVTATIVKVADRFKSFVHWNYTFTDKMSYTLFPFIAWFAVCCRTVIRLFT